MAVVSTEKWIKFFMKAGIPSRAASTYAVTFADNRIQMDMLLDLNKEYLRDMGITLMGDVIAILRHAREVHEEITHEKLLSSAKSSTISVKPAVNVKENAGSSLTSKTIRTSKVVKVPSKTSSSSSFSSSSSSQSSSSPSPPKKVSVLSRITDSNSKPSAYMRSSNSSLLPLSTAENNSVKRPLTATLKRKSGEITKPNVSTKAESCLEIPEPVKKVRRVLPEHEGGYKIKMPSGSTPRSQQILAKQKEANSKKTVFERLGESSSPGADQVAGAVSSTTSDPAFKVTGLEGGKKTKVTSVFSRLGDKQVSSSSAVPAAEIKSSSTGVLKTPVAKPMVKAPVVTRPTSMVADSLSSPGQRDVQSRIGTTKDISMKRLLSVPKQVNTMKRTATIVTVARPAKLVKTEGILAGHPGDISRPVKSRLGADEIINRTQVRSGNVPSRPLVPMVKQRVEMQRTGSSISIPTKRVTFSGAARQVTSRSGVFSRLGT